MTSATLNLLVLPVVVFRTYPGKRVAAPLSEGTIVRRVEAALVVAGGLLPHRLTRLRGS